MHAIVEKTQDVLRQLPRLMPFQSTYTKAKSDYLDGNHWFAYEAMLVYCDKYPQQEKGWVLLGLACDKLAQYEEGVGAFKQALCLEPSNTDSLYNLSRLLVCLNQSDVALRYIEHTEFLLQADGLVDEELAYLKAIAQEEVGDYDGALATLNALSLANESTRRFRAELFFHAKQYEIAVESLTTFLSEVPGDVTALTMLSLSLSKLGRWDEVVMHCQNILQLEPDNPHCLTLLGQSQLKQAQFATAKPYFEKALLVEPNLPQALLGLAQCLAKEGDDAEARLLLATVLSLVPQDSDEAEQAEKQLAALAAPEPAEAV